mmetsp:Transcript_12936/g.26800  ORF Transcript_12936/g.26800 Transcript_12936/m.26800 type:complete len:328 (-) Transcript_12936:175-1158(-)
MSYYSATNSGNNTGFGGNTGSAGYGGQGGNSFQQSQQQPQQNTGFSNNVSQWQAQPQTQQQPMQQQQQQQQTPQPFFAPSNVQQAVAQQAFQQGVNEVMRRFDVTDVGIPGLNYIMTVLRSYFAVDNHYVKRKMLRVLFPFLKKEWRRLQVEGKELVNYALPHSDENAPDLYVPVMSLITYCLLSAFLYGTAGQFNPEVIADVITKCFVTQVMEVLVIKGCLYSMQTPIHFLDLFSYTGYKYLGLTISMLCGIVFKKLDWGTASFYGAFLWTATAAAWFMMKTMDNNLSMQTSSTGPKRHIMVLAFAGSQVATMWFVSQTKYLSNHH